MGNDETTMRERLRQRLTELQGDLDVGQRRLQDLEIERTQLRDTLLRISGAMQVIQEVLGDETASAAALNGVHGDGQASAAGASA
jgi:predicted nuclease with TOPRIM domain